MLEQSQEEPYLQPLLDFSRIGSDPSGLDTFNRYRWQAKQVVVQWLTCLADTRGPIFLACEQVEDLSVLYVDRVRFLQYKTRDRGSWSIAGMCESGIDSLARSYLKARKFGLDPESKFELWLEGPISDQSGVNEFAKNPQKANQDTRERISNLGIEAADLDDFLRRLVIQHGQPSRAHIDSVVLRQIGALWPSLSSQESEHIYEQLLAAATAAQSGEQTPQTIYRNLVQARQDLLSKVTKEDIEQHPQLRGIASQVLTGSMIVALTPPRPTESNLDLIARIANGSHASLLELKLLRSGADDETVKQAKAMRADMEIERQLLMASRDPSSLEIAFEDLTKRVLITAKATAKRIGMIAVNNPSVASRPASAISSDLLSNPANLGSCDREGIFSQDGHAVYGFLCHLSDQCHFEWRH